MCLPVLVQNSCPISASISLCKAAKLVLSCLWSSPIPAYKARHELEESLNLYGVKLPLKFHKQDEYIWLKYGGNNRPGRFSCLAPASFFLGNCKVFHICLMISHTLLINSVLDNNLELSVNIIESSLGFVLAVSMALSYLQEGLWTSLSQLHSRGQAQGRFAILQRISCGPKLLKISLVRYQQPGAHEIIRDKNQD